MKVYAVAKPDAYVVGESEAKKIREQESDPRKHADMIQTAKRFEAMCLKKSTKSQ